MTQSQIPRHRQAFLLALGIAAIIFLPFVIYDGGYFIYYGDFNVQQIPFYKLAHEAVRSGNIFWNWQTDLGVNFIGSYSFYLLFSPFFWLTLPFPNAWVPALIAPLLVLKTACAALTSYLYLARFVRDSRYAVIGSLLYAFSGWMSFNIFFNHFHEVAVFFPLLLLGVEKLVTEGSRGFFAAMVAVNAMVNYWFFIGEVVFVILYFFIRLTDPAFRVKLSRFVQLALEAVLGVICAAVVLLPSVLALMGNPRTGTDELLTGWSAWLYWHEQRPVAILQSLLFPPELPARPNFFPDHGAKWASLSAWLPMASLVCVVAYFFRRRNDWVKKLLALCLVFSLVPWLNSLFILLNHSYYARWFYMPILLMCLATARELEDCTTDRGPDARALKWCAVVVAVFCVMSGLTPNFDEEGQLLFGMVDNRYMFIAYTIFAFAGLILTAVLLLRLRRNPRFVQLFGAGVALFSIVFSVFYMANGKVTKDRSDFIINTSIKGAGKIDLPGEPFARADIYEGGDNQLMFWGMPNIQAFHSIVPASIMEFYPAVGVKRDVGSRPEADYYALRPLLSVRWLFIQANKKEQEPMPGYTQHSLQQGFNIYENDNYLPMGFTYDKYITREQLEEIPKDHRDNILLRAVVLEEDAVERHGDILEQLSTAGSLVITEEGFRRDVAALGRMTATGFTVDRYGFTARTDFDEERLVFFSVPWEGGWSATVNREDVQIEKANIGFMAVRVPEGYCEIRFDYMTPGLKPGLAVSGGGLLVLFIWGVLLRKRRAPLPPPAEREDVRTALHQGETVRLSLEEYENLYGGERPQEVLQRALNEAAALHTPDAIPQSQQTIQFAPAKDPAEGEAAGTAAGPLGSVPDGQAGMPITGTTPQAQAGRAGEADRGAGTGDTAAGAAEEAPPPPPLSPFPALSREEPAEGPGPRLGKADRTRT